MNVEKLLACQEEFLERFPGGFMHPDMQEIARKHKVEQMSAKARAWCSPEALLEPLTAAANLVRLVSASSLISVFEKPKFRDFVLALPPAGKVELIGALRQRLHGTEPGDAEAGFNRMRDILAAGKLAKWSLLTVVPVYLDGQSEVFIKPTTTKGVITSFSLDGLVYSPKPTWQFYAAYRAALMDMKSHVDESLRPDSPAFTGFLMYFI